LRAGGYRMDSGKVRVAAPRITTAEHKRVEEASRARGAEL